MFPDNGRLIQRNKQRLAFLPPKVPPFFFFLILSLQWRWPLLVSTSSYFAAQGHEPSPPKELVSDSKRVVSSSWPPPPPPLRRLPPRRPALRLPSPVSTWASPSSLKEGGEGRKAAECLRTALRDYNLKFSTILNDPDLASFRALPEFKELQEEARLGGEDIGYGFRRDLKLISEVQAPFRGVRRFFYVALTAAAGISMFFTVPRLLRAIKGGDDAPDIWETAGNAAINIGGIIVLVALFIWDNRKEEEQLAQISRDETLSRLPVRLSTNRIVELVQLRDTARPVILAGNKETVSRAMEKAERFRTELLKRGVLLIPVIWGDYRQTPIDKKGFGLPPKAAASLPSIGEDFEKRTQSIVAKSRLKSEVRFKAEIVSPNEWQRWIRDQQKSEGVTPGDDVYIILRLDGRVRRSGKGMPDWQQIVKELPPLEALLSKLER
ncbi:protein LOW PSII ACCUMULATION 1, chloroplastic isoform X2 [Elaeis guineensis]|uniref:protein LOW PSII ACCUMULATION 1, chloroplastic isoform X2 n=1 Tax=Elaeis guineensis var. tenera TaxID=51953 RepID=UPI003C6D5CC6